jgi:type II secretory ATPase GspE/PulE/Tfp pilus assembly ATPase PilB-like protein
MSIKVTLLEKIKRLVEEGSEAILPKLLETILHYAYQQAASDIHVEAQKTQARVRLRIDGFLTTLITFPVFLIHPLISHLKVLAALDITERRLPQDGRFHMVLQQQRLEYRLSICPTIIAEKAVIRLVNANIEILPLKALGLLTTQLDTLEQVLKKPHGLILISGPTGSGKTLTQYAILNFLNQETRHLMSIEDPVELILPGINQIHVNNKTGLEFHKILRAILRQDPDIIMIGEIRDLETAEVALKAAQTGHLVLATVHANNAWDSLLRLQHLGLPRHALLSCIRLLIAQRLVRCLCKNCNAESCEHCFEGYKGRTGIFELIALEKNAHQDLHELVPPEYLALAAAGQAKVAAGITRQIEIERVI